MPSILLAWLQAARLPSYVNLAFPLLFGQALAELNGCAWRWPVFAWLMLYGWLDQLLIVFWNDYADVAADRLNHEYTIFSGGSRVVPSGKLSPRALLTAGWLCLALIAGIGLRLTLTHGLDHTLLFMAAGVMLLWLYSFPPFRLNYSGGGEILQGLGCGVLLPLAGFYAQCRTLADFPWPLLIPFFLYHTASSMATALPDVKADRLAGKATFPALFGPVGAARLINVITLMGSALGLLLTSEMTVPVRIFSHAVPAAICLALWPLTGRLERSRPALHAYLVAVIFLGISYAIGFCLQAWSF